MAHDGNGVVHEDEYEAAKRRNMARIMASLLVAKHMILTTATVPDNEDTFFGFAIIQRNATFQAIKLVMLQVPLDDFVLARLLLVAFHEAHGDEIQFNWDMCADGTFVNELNRVGF